MVRQRERLHEPRSVRAKIKLRPRVSPGSEPVPFTETLHSKSSDHTSFHLPLSLRPPRVELATGSILLAPRRGTGCGQAECCRWQHWLRQE